MIQRNIFKLMRNLSISNIDSETQMTTGETVSLGLDFLHHQILITQPLIPTLKPGQETSQLILNLCKHPGGRNATLRHSKHEMKIGWVEVTWRAFMQKKSDKMVLIRDDDSEKHIQTDKKFVTTVCLSLMSSPLSTFVSCNQPISSGYSPNLQMKTCGTNNERDKVSFSKYKERT